MQLESQYSEPKLKADFEDMLNAICNEGNRIQEGEFDIHEHNLKSTLKEKLLWIIDNKHILASYPHNQEFPTAKKMIRELEMNFAFAYNVLAQFRIANAKLLG